MSGQGAQCPAHTTNTHHDKLHGLGVARPIESDHTPDPATLRVCDRAVQQKACRLSVHAALPTEPRVAGAGATGLDVT